MRRFLVDTNVLIDMAVKNRPRHEEAIRILARARMDKAVVLLVFLPNLKDAYYVVQRHYGDEPFARKCIGLLYGLLEGVGMDKRITEEALRSDEPDFEDGLVRAAAEFVGCDGIISRDVEAFSKSRCGRIDPAEFLELRF